MKVFIAGSRSIRVIPDSVVKKINAVCRKHYSIIIGDCYGVDTAVQKLLSDRKYQKVSVYATGKPRNNIGNWSVVSVSGNGYAAFDFYKQKDLQMINDCDCGIFIWNGKSRGTREDYETLVKQNKTVILYNEKNESLKIIKPIPEPSLVTEDVSIQIPLQIPMGI